MASSDVYMRRVPVISTSMTKRARVPNDPDRERELSSRQAKMRGLKSGRPHNMQSCVYYRIRCILSGDLSKAFEQFGDGVSQRNLLGIRLRLAITESPFVAMEYERRIRRRASALSRKRYNDVGTAGYFAPLTTDQADITRSVLASAV